MNSKYSRRLLQRPARALRHGIPAFLGCVALGFVTTALAAPNVPISQIPMTIQQPANPQIIFAVANSQSMDGDLSGAILTGAGMLGGNYSPPNGYGQLNNSSSPPSYTIPVGFTPPANPGPGDGTAPYTVNVGGNLVDNSASRLNVAKAGITAVLNNYMQSADFALVDYSTWGVGEYETWVYLMSPQTGPFTFTNTPGLNRVVANPCFNYLTINDWVAGSCAALQAHYVTQDVNDSQWLVIGASSDDPAINDVLYAPNGYAWPVCVVFGGPNPATPFPPSYSLWSYETGGVAEGYTNATPGCGGVETTNPTNAGYVPYAPETMYVARGFGYYGGQEPGTGSVKVPMTSAGATPTTASVNAALAFFAQYLAPETSNGGTPEIKAEAVQSPIAGLLVGAQNYYATNPPSSNGCNPERYVVLVTDGLPTLDLANHAWPPLGAASASPPPTGYGVTATFNADGSLASTNDQALTDAINELATLKARGIKTYVIGLGAGVEPTVNPVASATLTAMAVAGGTNVYFPATNPTDLTNDMQVILAAILAQKQATSTAAVNSTGLRAGDVVYQSQFVTSDADLDWTGELYAFPVNATTGVVDALPAAALWSAKTQLQSQGWDLGRVIATWDPNANGGAGGGTPFRWNPGLAPAGISATTTLGAALQTFAADTNGQDVLQYLRGNNALEQKNGGTFRNRTWKLGDIVASQPLYVGAPVGYSLDPTYISFAATNANRPPILYVGANDGMLHAFDATTGNERFAFIPNGVWNRLVRLVNPYYNEQHRFFVNGSPVASDVKFSDNSWHTVVVTPEGAGGKTLFALDVTTPSSLTTESALAAAALWEFTDPDMGDSFSQPVIVNTNAGNLTIFGNGYNSPSGNPFLYAVNTQTGALVAKINLCQQVSGICNASLANGLSSAIAVNTSGQLTQNVNMVYAGDLQGNLWKIDISSATVTSWTPSVLLQATDPSGNPQPITTAPVASLNSRYPNLLGAMVFFGTGQLLGDGDLTSTQIQSIYGVYDSPAGYSAPLNRNNPAMVQQVLTSGSITTASGGTEDVRFITANPVVLPNKAGWFIDLNLIDGERSVTTPVLEGAGDLVLTTYFPNSSYCTGGGQSWLMVLNYASGGSFPTPQLDVSGNPTISSADLGTGAEAGQVPVGMFLGNVYATSPVMFTGGAGGTNISEVTVSGQNGTAGAPPIPDPSCSGGQCTGILPTPLAGLTHHRISWWEVR